MLRKILPLALVAACFVVAFSASVSAAQAPAPAIQPTPVTASAQEGSPTIASEQCLPESLVLPAPLLLAGNQTCDECLADCTARENRCYDHCTGRNCIMKCTGQYAQCANNCPC